MSAKKLQNKHRMMTCAQNDSEQNDDNENDENDNWSQLTSYYSILVSPGILHTSNLF